MWRCNYQAEIRFDSRPLCGRHTGQMDIGARRLHQTRPIGRHYHCCITIYRSSVVHQTNNVQRYCHCCAGPAICLQQFDSSHSAATAQCQLLTRPICCHIGLGLSVGIGRNTLVHTAVCQGANCRFVEVRDGLRFRCDHIGTNLRRQWPWWCLSGRQWRSVSTRRRSNWRRVVWQWLQSAKLPWRIYKSVALSKVDATEHVMVSWHFRVWSDTIIVIFVMVVVMGVCLRFCTRFGYLAWLSHELLL